MKITVCVGSSCHVKGSHEVVARLEQLITEHQLKDQVEMTGTFCIGRCQEGVCVLVDGEFVQAKHDISLRFRGSSNQRLLDVKKTLAAGQPVWWEDEKVFATHSMER